MNNLYNRTASQDNPSEINTTSSSDGLISVFGLFSVKPVILLITAIIGYFVYSKFIKNG